MNKSALIIFLLSMLCWSSAFASLVKEEVGVGPVDIQIPRWHQGIALKSFLLSVDYASSSDQPGPFSSINAIRVEADLGRDGRLEIAISISDVCEETWNASSDTFVVEGQRCLSWDESSRVVITFHAKFNESSIMRGLEYLTMTSIEIKGRPSEAIFLCNPFVSDQI